MTAILRKTLQDIFSRDVLPFVLTVGIGSIFVWIVPLWWISGGVVHLLSWLTSFTPWAQSWEEPDFWTTLKIGYVLLIITISIATAIWGEGIVRKRIHKHYPNVEAQGSGQLHRSLYYTLKANGMFVLLLILFSPLLFVPYLGKIVLVYLWSVQLKEPTSYDVGTMIGLTKKEIKLYTQKSRWVSLFVAALNFIPIVNFFVPLFAQILFAHFVLDDRADSK